MIFPISASQVARVIGVSHPCPAEGCDGKIEFSVSICVVLVWISFPIF
jgi:hypothetical protein